METRPRFERKVLPRDVVDPIALQYVDDLVVGMAVLGRSAGRNDADELGDVEATRVLIHEVAELAVWRRRQGGLVGVANEHTPVVADALFALREP